MTAYTAPPQKKNAPLHLLLEPTNASVHTQINHPTTRLMVAISWLATSVTGMRVFLPAAVTAELTTSAVTIKCSGVDRGDSDRCTCGTLAAVAAVWAAVEPGGWEDGCLVRLAARLLAVVAVAGSWAWLVAVTASRPHPVLLVMMRPRTWGVVQRVMSVYATSQTIEE